MALPMLALAQQNPQFLEVTNHGLTGTYAGSLDCVDVNADGDIDCLQSGFSQYDFVGKANLTQLSTGNGDGSFTDVDVPIPNLRYGSAKFFDANSDGIPDIFALGSGDNLEAYAGIFLGDNAGGFSHSQNMSQNLVGLVFAKVTFGNIDGQDYVITTGSDENEQKRTITYKNDNGVYVIVPTIFVDITNAEPIIFDYNNDGHNDVLIIGSTGTSVVARLYKNNGTGNFSFTEVSNPFTPSGQGSTYVADINNDGYMDVTSMGAIVGGSDVFDTYINNQDGTFSHYQSLPGLSSGQMVLGDVNGDGFVDMLAGGVGDDYYINLYLNDQTGTMNFYQSFEPGLWGVSLALVDLDNDDLLDVIFTGQIGPFGEIFIKVFLQQEQIGVNEFTAESLILYPNPTRGMVNLKIPSNLTDVTVSVVDVMGRAMNVRMLNGSIDLSSCAAGMYLVSIHSNNKTLTKRVIKQ